MARGFNYAAGASAEVDEARQPGLHKTHLMALGSSKNNLVRTVIAGREDCPLGLMVTLAHDYSAEVRMAVAGNPSAPRTVMAYLSADRNTDVVKALVTNRSLSAEVLEELAFHKKSDVRAAAALRLDMGEPAIPAALAEDNHTPELAEHVMPVPVSAAEPMTADGAVAGFAPVNVVDISTRAPITASFGTPAPYGTPAPTVAAASGPVEPVIPQIFAPHSTPDAPAPTRTAPVRGFKPKT